MDVNPDSEYLLRYFKALFRLVTDNLMLRLRSLANESEYSLRVKYYLKSRLFIIMQTHNKYL